MDEHLTSHGTVHSRQYGKNPWFIGMATGINKSTQIINVRRSVSLTFYLETVMKENKLGKVLFFQQVSSYVPRFGAVTKQTSKPNEWFGGSSSTHLSRSPVLSTSLLGHQCGYLQG